MGAAILSTIGLAQEGRLLEAVRRALTLLEATEGESALRLLNVLGACYDLLERPEEAVGCYRNALQRCGGDHDQTRRKVLVNLGVALARLGEHAEALSHFDQARVLAVEPAQRARLEMDAALSHLAMDRLETAGAALFRARAEATRAGHTVTLFFIRHNEGLLDEARGRIDDARAGFLSLLAEALPPSLEAATLLALARVSRGPDRVAAARRVLELNVDSDEHAIPAAELLAGALEEQGDLAGALVATKDLYRRAEARYEERHRRSLDLLRVQHEVSTLRARAVELAEANARLRVLNRDKDELLAIIGHDLRSPLTAVMMIADRLQDAPPPAQTVLLGTQLMGSADRMHRLIRQLVDAHEVEAGQDGARSELDGASLAREVVGNLDPIARKKGIALRYIGPETLSVVGEPRALEQVLSNLVDNALKFSSDGTVTLELQPGPRFVVEDEGPGLSDVDLLRAFGKFERLSARPTAGETSTGLGLYIVQGLVRRMGGRVQASNHDRGARFVVELPGG